MIKQTLAGIILSLTAITATQAAIVDNGDGTITDTAAGLMWLQDANQMSAANWSTSKANAEALSFAGHNDWRQPEIGELQDLYAKLSSGGTFDPSPFVNLTIDGYTDWHWSNNQDNPGCSPAWACNNTWYFDFETGTAQQTASTYTLYSLPVRTVTSASCPLVDNGDGTITDPNTGLMWLQDADTVGATGWNNAASIITAATYAGYSDWRLPEITELEGLYAKLTESGSYNPAPFVNLEINGSSDWHWSNTTEGQQCWWQSCFPTKYYLDISTGTTGAAVVNYSLSSVPVRTATPSCN